MSQLRFSSTNGRDEAMKVKLIDVDNKYREKKRRGKRFPNLALMKISAYEKAQGNEVGFDIENPDKTYISCVFKKNRLYAIKECCDVKNGITFGGSGLSLEFSLPPQIELLKPDYDLYPFQEYSMGFTTRGCPNDCPWCIVHKKEGHFRIAQHIREFHDFRFKSCKLLDNNILVNKDWFFENTDWAIAHNVKLNITQGMDIRLLTDEIADQLKRIKFVDQQVCFAWDRMKDEKIVKAGIEMLRDHGINIRRNVSFYVLSGFNTTFEQDLYRVKELKKTGAMAFVMKYHDDNPELNHLARYCDKRELYRSCTFEEYLVTKQGAVTP
jgi:hypothetical protein